jgi:protein TonB
MSRMRSESGTVVLRVLVGVDGRAQTARIEKSSGYPRLDQSARDTVKDLGRFQPGTEQGGAKARLEDVPITFELGD